MNWLSEKLNIKTIEDWYTVSREVNQSEVVSIKIIKIMKGF